ncbi:MAG: HAD-IA family hydrolase, partial [Candidatus Kapaibacterium sp.]
MKRKEISIIILDLDNTLWDWLEIWHKPFSALLDMLTQHNNISRDNLIKEIKIIHQRHGTSEYPFLIEEIKSLQPQEPDKQGYDEIIRLYDRMRLEAVQLYPTVFETLWALKDIGCAVIGYTESMAAYTNHRIRNSCIDGLLDIVYTPTDHALPQNLTNEQRNRYFQSEDRLRKTSHKLTPKGELKPNPKILKEIIDNIKGSYKRAIYVGDNLMKDIAMAQEAGVIDVYAQYGDRRDSESYELLRQVTHWTSEDVEREKAIHKGENITPTYTLDHCLCQIFTHFNF